MSSRRRRRRGIVLLVCLVMLVLFLLLGITFVLTALQWRKSAGLYARSVDQRDDGVEVADSALRDLLRGAQDPASPLHYWNLLNDMYGNDSVRGMMTTTNTATRIGDGTFTGTPPATVNPFAPITITTAAECPLNPTDYYYAGCVMTMLDGPAAGQSRRIIDYVANSTTTATFQVERFSGSGPVSGNQVLINGRPFNGGGNGYNPDPTAASITAGRPTAVDQSGRLYALLPNLVWFDNSNTVSTPPYMAPGGTAGLDVGYTAADFNHPFLAAVEPGATNSSQIKPSFHDPALLNYWNVFHTGTAGTVDKLTTTNIDTYRKASFRPLQNPDNPKFTGSNYAYNPLTGPWDVDNDGDMIPDSVWVDCGLPARKSVDGRMYKPLVAFLIRDLDGRVNLNVHGTRDMYQSYYTGTFPSPVLSTDLYAGGTTTIAALNRGSGYGPAEINPIYLFAAAAGAPGDPTNATAKAQFQALLEGGLNVNGVDLPGRFGVDTVSTFTPTNTRSGWPGQWDVLSRILFCNLYGDPNAFILPPDIYGRNTVALDLRGLPIFTRLDTATSLMIASNAGDPSWNNNPYEQAISQSLSSNGNDSPYTPQELEGLLREWDIDGLALARRPLLLAPLLAGMRNEFTTLSWDVPVPNIEAPQHLREILRKNKERALHVTDILRARVIKESGFTLPLSAANTATCNGVVNTLLTKRVISADLLAGLKFDINRLFGNGIDDVTINGVVDDDAEIGTEYVYPATLTDASTGLIPGAGASTQPRTQFRSVLVDRNNDGTPATTAKFAKQTYAKQLYVLLMTLIDMDAVTQNTTLFPGAEWAGLSVANKKELIARRLAQYAINVVDFRDPDDTMTPFEYDVNPFNGWDVDGEIDPAITPSDNSHAERRLIWGCEGPSALLTETIAFHDVRTKDAATDSAGSSHATPTDPSFDSIALPVGSLFVELYNVGRFTINLGQTTSVGLPVWRLAISERQVGTGATTPISTLLTTKPDSTTLEPELTKDATNTAVTATPIERVIWFCNTAPSTLVGGGILTQAEANKVFYNRATGSDPVALPPSKYLVLGPRTTTNIGKLSNGTGTNSPQVITLNPAGSPTIAVTDVTPTSTMPSTSTQIQVPLVRICAADKPGAAIWNTANTNVPPYIGMNVSEPLVTTVAGDYYPEPTTGQTDFKYTTPKDVPLDDPASTVPTAHSPASFVYAAGIGTTYDFRTIFLQRLANKNLPWNATTNPYITIDAMPVDLTLFNGDAATMGTTGIGTGQPKAFRSRERGEFTVSGGSTYYNLWPPAIGAAKNPPVTAASGVTTSFFNYALVHSMGFLNHAFAATPGPTFPQLLTQTDVASNTNNYGDPRSPFPFLTWLDRPYVSQYELLQVPTSTPERLNLEFSNQISSGGGDPYTNFTLPYRHLFNVFQTGKNAAPTTDGPQLGRVLDYLYVPSKYTETQQVLNPSAFSGTGNGKGRFHPPFNLLSRYREPGRINVNALSNQYVFQALGNGGSGPSWQNFVTSRRGYGTPSTTQLTLDTGSPPSPTYFGNPFRSQAAWDLFPTASSPSIQNPPGLPSPRREVDVSLLRPDPTTTTQPMFAGTTLNAYNNWQPNSYFRYQPLTQLGNLTTTRSNVFAVWITVGYFEVEPGAVDAQHPDGYRLSAEIGSDTGQLRRHRAFYIIDRTIPVGFEIGRDYNTSNTIVLRTQIE